MSCRVHRRRVHEGVPDDDGRIVLCCAGFIGEEYLKECLMTMGDRWTEDMVDELFHGAPIADGRFDYHEFTRTLKHGAREKDEDSEGQGQQQGQGQQVQGQNQAAAAPPPKSV